MGTLGLVRLPIRYMAFLAFPADGATGKSPSPNATQHGTLDEAAGRAGKTTGEFKNAYKSRMRCEHLILVADC
jgi:hypothetical protein